MCVWKKIRVGPKGLAPATLKPTDGETGFWSLGGPASKFNARGEKPLIFPIKHSFPPLFVKSSMIHKEISGGGWLSGLPCYPPNPTAGNRAWVPPQWNFFPFPSGWNIEVLSSFRASCTRDLLQLMWFWSIRQEIFRNLMTILLHHQHQASQLLHNPHTNPKQISHMEESPPPKAADIRGTKCGAN